MLSIEANKDPQHRFALCNGLGISVLSVCLSKKCGTVGRFQRQFCPVFAVITVAVAASVVELEEVEDVVSVEFEFFGHWGNPFSSRSLFILKDLLALSDLFCLE